MIRDILVLDKMSGRKTFLEYNQTHNSYFGINSACKRRNF